jgi:glucokinase
MPPKRVIGVDAGGTKLLGGVVDEGLVVHNRVHRLWRGADREETLRIVVEAVEELRSAAPEAEAVGFGIPSLVSAGRSVASVHLPLDDVPFDDLMAERLGLPVWVDNDVNAAVMAEHRVGAARGASHAVMFALGTGIGGGLVLDGRVYRGATGAAGELGHMVTKVDGPPCPCGGRGCLEVLASGTAIGIAGTEAGRAHPRSPLGTRLEEEGAIRGSYVTELAHAGDELAVEAVCSVGRQLGAGLVSILNVLDPEVAVIGGGAVAAGDLLLEPAREVLAAQGLGPPRMRVVPAEFGGESGMLGAALLALDGMGLA